MALLPTTNLSISIIVGALRFTMPSISRWSLAPKSIGYLVMTFEISLFRYHRKAALVASTVPIAPDQVGWDRYLCHPTYTGG